MMHFDDPPLMPGTGEEPGERYARAAALSGTPAEAYLARRMVPVAVAEAAGVRFDANFAGRPAVVAALRDGEGAMTSLHGRYLEVRSNQNKMRTVGVGGGVIEMPGGLKAEQPILVEGLFDALSLASCGWPCLATIGRWAPWLTRHCAGRVVWLAFDAGRPGEGEAVRYSGRLGGSTLRRLPPPPRCQDWNTALVKRGPGAVARWIREAMAAAGDEA